MAFLPGIPGRDNLVVQEILRSASQLLTLENEVGVHSLPCVPGCHNLVVHKVLGRANKFCALVREFSMPLFPGIPRSHQAAPQPELGAPLQLVLQVEVLYEPFAPA